MQGRQSKAGSDVQRSTAKFSPGLCVGFERTFWNRFCDDPYLRLSPREWALHNTIHFW